MGTGGVRVPAHGSAAVRGIDFITTGRNGVEFNFLKYTCYAFPMMIVSIAISRPYVWLRYF